MTIKPIETLYRGHYFRSKAEARFAVFLDCLGVKWDYEPQGFDLGNGLKMWKYGMKIGINAITTHTSLKC